MAATTLLLVLAFGGTALSAAIPAPASAAPGQNQTVDRVDFFTAVKTARPGQTITLKPGAYRLPVDGEKKAYDVLAAGTPEQPITFRAAPGEKVQIDGPLGMAGEYTTWIGIEFIRGPQVPRIYRTDWNKSFDVPGKFGNISVTAPHVKIINCIVRDSTGSGITIHQDESAYVEVYGCIIYGNGMSQWGHAVYANGATIGTKLVEEVVAFGNSSLGITLHHARGTQPLKGFVFRGNVAFANGFMKGAAARDFDIGLRKPEVSDLLIEDNFGYPTANSDAVISYGVGKNVRLGRNYFVKPRLEGGAADLKFENGLKRTGQEVFVRPNKYERGRAHIIVYNWEKKPTAEVDLGGLLHKGQAFRVLDVQNLEGKPVLSGTYTGEALRLGLAPGEMYKPEAVNFPQDRLPKSTLPEFGCFLLLPY